MKIIGRDNFDRDSVSDILIAENVHEAWAERIVTFLNGSNGYTGPWYCQVVDDSYQLYNWEP